MSTLMITLLGAFIATVLAITCLAIGWLLSGRSRIVRGSCGTDPKGKKDDRCGTKTHCGICELDVHKTSPEDKV